MVAGGDCSSCWKLCARLASGLVGAACAPGTLGALCCRAHDVYRSSLIAEDYLGHDSAALIHSATLSCTQSTVAILQNSLLQANSVTFEMADASAIEVWCPQGLHSPVRQHLGSDTPMLSYKVGRCATLGLIRTARHSPRCWPRAGH